MRIAYDHQIFSGQKYGGISKYYYQLVKNISKTDNRVRIFSPIHRNYYIQNLPQELVKGVKLDKYPFGSYGDKIVTEINRVLLKPILNQYQPDIIHETFFSKHKSGSMNVPTVITVYDMIHELFDFYLPPYHRGWAEKKIAIDRADHIICISENTKKDLIDLFNIEESKISITYLAFERSQLSDKTNNFIINKRPFLLYVGWREWYKNFKPFLKSISRSKSIMNDFDIIAFGGGEFSVEELKLMTELGFRNRQVRQISGSDKLLAKYYSQARAFIFPSLYEGFGLPPLEAMSYNCPVISSNASCMPEVVGDAAEYFDPNSLDEMLESVEKTVYSDSRINELVLLGKQQIEKYSWQKCASETLSIYQSII